MLLFASNAEIPPLQIVGGDQNLQGNLCGANCIYAVVYILKGDLGSHDEIVASFPNIGKVGTNLSEISKYLGKVGFDVKLCRVTERQIALDRDKSCYIVLLKGSLQNHLVVKKSIDEHSIEIIDVPLPRKIVIAGQFDSSERTALRITKNVNPSILPISIVSLSLIGVLVALIGGDLIHFKRSLQYPGK